MTAYATTGDKERCLVAGMNRRSERISRSLLRGVFNDYTTKPLDPKGFLEKIERWTSTDLVSLA